MTLIIVTNWKDYLFEMIAFINLYSCKLQVPGMEYQVV